MNIPELTETCKKISEKLFGKDGKQTQSQLIEEATFEDSLDEKAEGIIEEMGWEKALILAEALIHCAESHKDCEEMEDTE